MRGFLILLSILIAVMFGVSRFAAARADDGSFLVAAHEAGFVMSDDDLLRNGYMACSVRENLGDYLTSRLIGRVAGVAQSRGEQFLAIAKVHLCQ